jgi:hypothetical protein
MHEVLLLLTAAAIGEGVRVTCTVLQLCRCSEYTANVNASVVSTQLQMVEESEV